jgi:hypothetical protein
VPPWHVAGQLYFTFYSKQTAVISALLQLKGDSVVTSNFKRKLDKILLSICMIVCVFQQAAVTKRYLQCPALVKIAHLKKFLRLKYELNASHLVSIRKRLSLH